MLRRESPDSQSCNSIIELIDERASQYPNTPAFGVANFCEADAVPKHRVGGTLTGVRPLPVSVGGAMTFSDLANLSRAASVALAEILPCSQSCIGLLSISNFDFVLTWLGLMRLGRTVLLLACVSPCMVGMKEVGADSARPQLNDRAIKHLCGVLSVKHVLLDGSQRRSVGGLTTPYVPNYKMYQPQPNHIEASTYSENQIAYFSHSSGTSGGFPKPIAQWNSSVAALPVFTGPGHAHTFSATPLYHGGLADCLRSWSSGAMIWIFPEGIVPLTTDHVLRAVKLATDESNTKPGFFSCVPQVLRILAEEERGIELLKSMDLVGVGGAAIGKQTGDMLVRRGVKLLSRFGSAECGFLLSSHRNYCTDYDWDYLRLQNGVKCLQFERRAGGLSELVVRPGWPVIPKVNREDGSYATSDLFEPHPLIPNAWRYHSREDSQIALSNGKKFDPEPTERSILAAVPFLRDLYIFGNGRPCAGAVVFSTEADAAKALNAVRSALFDMNSHSSDHERINSSMLVVVTDIKLQLPKSSKGSIVRSRADEMLASYIGSAYETSPSPQVLDDELYATVVKCFESVSGRAVDCKKDLYHQGVDSIACTQIRLLIQASCLGENILPSNCIYDQGTIAKLVPYLQSFREGGRSPGSTDLVVGTMWTMTAKYSLAQAVVKAPPRGGRNAVVLTGATGFLGSYILSLLSRLDTVRVYCLVRASNKAQACDRIARVLSNRSGWANVDCGKITAIPYDTDKPDLGLLGDDRNLLEESAVFVHAAWPVNFRLALASFETHLDATRKLLEIACTCGARFVFVSSVASVGSAKRSTVFEAFSDNPSDAGSLGYAQSKWVAEQVCVSASNKISVSIVRLGQLCGDSTGAWNTSESYPIMLSSGNLVGCLPELPGVTLCWLPVHIAARAILDISFAPDGEIFYHVLRSHGPEWRQLHTWIAKEERGSIELVPPEEWLDRLEQLSTRHSSERLLDFWRAEYCHGKDFRHHCRFDTSSAERASPAISSLQPMAEKDILQMWKWIQGNVS